MNGLKQGQTLVASGHTHGADAITGWVENGKMNYYSSDNRFSDHDIETYNNAIKQEDGSFKPNKYDKKLQGFVVTPNGGLLHYDPDKSYKDVKVKGQYGLSPSYNLPIYDKFPSDKNPGDLRLNKIDPIPIPNLKIQN